MTLPEVLIIGFCTVVVVLVATWLGFLMGRKTTVAVVERPKTYNPGEPVTEADPFHDAMYGGGGEETVK